MTNLENDPLEWFLIDPFDPETALLALANGGDIKDIKAVFALGQLSKAQLEDGRKEAIKSLNWMCSSKPGFADRAGKKAVKKLAKSGISRRAYLSWNEGLTVDLSPFLEKSPGSLEERLAYAIAIVADLCVVKKKESSNAGGALVTPLEITEEAD